MRILPVAEQFLQLRHQGHRVLLAALAPEAQLVALNIAQLETYELVTAQSGIRHEVQDELVCG
jgi:hypothetical protein